MQKETSIPSLLKRHKPQLIAGILTLSAVDLIQMAIPLVIKRAIDAFADGVPEAADIIRACALYILGMGLVMAVFRLGWRYFIMGTARKIEWSIRNEFFSHLQRLDVARVSSHKVGDLMARTVNDIETLKFACGLGVLVAYDGLFLLVFIMGAMFYISPSVAAVLCIPFLLMMVFVIKGGRSIEKRFGKTQESFSDLTESARRPFHGIKAVKSLGMEDKETENFSRSSEAYVRNGIRLAKLWAVYQPAISACVGAAGVVFLFLGGLRAITGSITLGDFTALLVYLSMLGWPMTAMGWAQDILRRGSSSVKRLNAILKLDTEPTGREGEFSPRIKGSLEVCEVRHSFGGKMTLDGCSFQAEPGETIGIVGRTGSGKTTLARIIRGDLVPDSGLVFIGGTDSRFINRRKLRREIAYVDRDALIFSGTVRENINFMKPCAEERTVKAMEICCIREEIEGFEGRLDAVVGERGINLSEGQKQRISIARSIMLGPAILILDDALSSVDLSTEARMIKNLRLWAERSETLLLIISSRTNSTRIMDSVMVLSGGRIAEKGTHGELVSKDGMYAGMYRIQTQ